MIERILFDPVIFFSVVVNGGILAYIVFCLFRKVHITFSFISIAAHFFVADADTLCWFPPLVATILLLWRCPIFL
jgi:hypothetical protein